MLVFLLSAIWSCCGRCSRPACGIDYRSSDGTDWLMTLTQESTRDNNNNKNKTCLMLVMWGLVLICRSCTVYQLQPFSREEKWVFHLKWLKVMITLQKQWGTLVGGFSTVAQKTRYVNLMFKGTICKHMNKLVLAVLNHNTCSSGDQTHRYTEVTILVWAASLIQSLHEACDHSWVLEHESTGKFSFTPSSC